MRIGVISDTHGSLPQWVAPAFEGADLIMHAGDVGAMTVLDELALIAPVVAVHGNMDSAPELVSLPDHVRLIKAGARLLMVHEPGRAPSLLATSPADVVVVGHTHQSKMQLQDGRLTVNPGSASRPLDGTASVALLEIRDGVPTAQIVRE